MRFARVAHKIGIDYCFIGKKNVLGAQEAPKVLETFPSADQLYQIFPRSISFRETNVVHRETKDFLELSKEVDVFKQLMIRRLVSVSYLPLSLKSICIY